MCFVSGEIRQLEPLDRETQATYTLDVVAFDRAANDRDSSARLIIFVLIIDLVKEVIL